MRLFFWVVTFQCFAAYAQSAPERLRIPRVARAPKLADFANGVPRERELAIADFRQMDPTDGAPVSQPTTAFLSFDQRNLYVGWICKDAPISSAFYRFFAPGAAPLPVKMPRSKASAIA